MIIYYFSGVILDLVVDDIGSRMRETDGTVYIMDKFRWRKLKGMKRVDINIIFLAFLDIFVNQEKWLVAL